MKVEVVRMLKNITENEILHTIKEIIARVSSKDNPMSITASQIEDCENIAQSRLLQMDSIKAIRIVVEIEKVFEISVPDEDLDMKNFKTPYSMACYVMKQLDYVKEENETSREQGVQVNIS